MYLQALKGEGGESGGTKGRKTLLPPGSEFKAFLPSIPFNSRKMHYTTLVKNLTSPFLLKKIPLNVDTSFLVSNNYLKSCS